MKTFAISIFLIIAVHFSHAQNFSIDIGTNIPLNYSAGINMAFTKRISTSLHSGILTWPYDQAILEILKTFDTEEALAKTIGEAFTFGYCIQPEIHLNFKRFYTGIIYSWYTLSAKEAPLDAINNYYSLSLPRLMFFKPVEYNLQAKLHNAGLLIGKYMPHKVERFGWKVELAIQKSFYSRSELSSPSEITLRNASTLINNELKGYFEQYGFLPSLNIYFSVKL